MDIARTLLLLAVGLVLTAVALHYLHPCVFGFDMMINDDCQFYVNKFKPAYEDRSLICFQKVAY